ncbi:MAG TPA: type II toxin-antitoxin system RelE/ParE family toxin [Thermoanaerobaculia bacterium]|nr:type II toxin-antitoxin system RelE/ParE family toxin [Thermoanaerobaculia bacterium]
MPAKGEIRDAARWYRERSPAVAQQFIAETRRALEFLEEFPGAGSAIPYADDPQTRRFPIRTFPYQIVFVELDDILEVVAVAHDQRRPGYWIPR